MDVSKEIIEAVKDAGIVGAGGAGFPAHIKLNAKCEVVIANMAECEPLLFTNQALVEHHPDEVLQGLQIAMQATGAKKGVIAMKKKYEACKKALEGKVGGYENIVIHELGDFYPAGDEHVMIKEVLKRTMPMSGIPADVGAVVHNVETLYNIKKAYCDKKPVTEKFVTVAGAVRHPLVVKVPIGLRFAELLDLAGGPTVKNYILVDGGPMMGNEVDAGDAVTKTTSALLVIPEGTMPYISRKTRIEVMLNRARAACCQCRNCTDMCPRYLLGHSLEPHRIMRTVSYGIPDPETVKNSLLCSECGLCEIICSMGLSPRRINSKLKRLLQEKKIRFPKMNVERERFERESRKYPTKKLIARLGLYDYSHPIDYADIKIDAKEVKLMLRQYAGLKLLPLVKEKDEVKAGELIAKAPEGKPGVNLHASIDGIVASIDETSVVIRRE
ncbi:4Fe-4S dicluster domain-containing protein [Thermosediminibacter litoriperuensis]|uniref:Na+-translocating ferredoxin:NAD+ oxidoreductase RnfC subunit n=1 Tax=Thermosediminibacter litoriperuensis TaxID=291989 RepID=A0A5S5AT81_9FIRM|nr:4Fe-4S dicluster domain-containing protein [Thermosediminibacter litoriperuensis]TYP55479.1 Na+-translocating ferredoxin:NAD+ oxidoreductase RnfC subunit [Thermosediminibacter litoriperuensis]